MLIDLHAHILPGVDDGAKTIEDSLAMAEVASKDGINMLVATPHVIRDMFDNRKEDILEAVATLNEKVAANNIDLLVLPGAEYRLEPDLAKRLADGELLTINNSGRYLLIELPSTLIPENTESILYEIQLQGVTPVIAHPERNRVLSRHPEILESYNERGILAQITAGSITGLFGRSAKKLALKWLQTGIAQLIASDAHDAKGRAPVLSMAFQEIESRWGLDLALTLTDKNPDLIIKGLPLNPVVPKMVETPWAAYFMKLRTARSDISRK